MADIMLEHAHGAMTRIGVGDTAFPYRPVAYNMLSLTQWANPADTERNIAWTRESLRSHASVLQWGALCQLSGR
jgi:hypothetical protein